MGPGRKPRRPVFLRRGSDFLGSSCLGSSGYVQASTFVCLFELMLYVPVNSKGHVRMLPPLYGTLTQNEDVMTSNKYFKYNHPRKPKGLVYADGSTWNHFSWAGLTSNQIASQHCTSFAWRHKQPIYFFRPKWAGACSCFWH